MGPGSSKPPLLPAHPAVSPGTSPASSLRQLPPRRLLFPPTPHTPAPAAALPHDQRAGAPTEPGLRCAGAQGPQLPAAPWRGLHGWVPGLAGGADPGGRGLLASALGPAPGPAVFEDTGPHWGPKSYGSFGRGILTHAWFPRLPLAPQPPGPWPPGPTAPWPRGPTAPLARTCCCCCCHRHTGSCTARGDLICCCPMTHLCPRLPTASDTPSAVAWTRARLPTA